MLKEKLKMKNKNYMKMNILFLFLIIINIVLYIGLMNYYSTLGFGFDLKTFDELSAVLATMIILGFVSNKLPKINDIGDNAIYGMMYLIIICAVGLMTSYFNSKVDTPALFGPYLEMFKMLCTILIFVILAVRIKPFKEILSGKHTRKNQLICLIIFTALGLLASKWYQTIGNTPANVRCMLVMISGLFGGPIVGIPVGIISGAYRFTLGGTTALPCAISTVISGIVGSLIFLWNDKKFPRSITTISLMFLFTGFEMYLIVLLTPPNISYPFIGTIYPVMLFASVIGIILFSIVIKEERQRINSIDIAEEIEIQVLKNELDEHDATIEELKNEIKKLKKEKQ